MTAALSVLELVALGGLAALCFGCAVAWALRLDVFERTLTEPGVSSEPLAELQRQGAGAGGRNPGLAPGSVSAPFDWDFEWDDAA